MENIEIQCYNCNAKSLKYINTQKRIDAYIWISSQFYMNLIIIISWELYFMNSTAFSEPKNSVTWNYLLFTLIIKKFSILSHKFMHYWNAFNIIHIYLHFISVMSVPG